MVSVKKVKKGGIMSKVQGKNSECFNDYLSYG